MMRWLRRQVARVIEVVIRIVRNDPRNPYEKLAFDAIYGAHHEYRRDK